jgi:4'-phosphopantetheinyl transferase
MEPSQSLLTPAGEIHVWRVDLGREPALPADRLPRDERERAAAIVRSEARRRWVAARWALREVLGRYLDRDPAAVGLRLGENGKPMLAEPGATLHFNLSHSGDRALIAISHELEVGVDIQQMRRLRGPKRPAAFYAAWTRREAIAKCHGTGLWSPQPDTPVAVARLDAEPGYAGALAVAAGELPPLRHFEAAPRQAQTSIA